METKWLEDFLSLARTMNFSRSADERFVTQPAFSRRIKALEVWAGTPLIDRDAYPIELTTADPLGNVELNRVPFMIRMKLGRRFGISY